MIPELKSEGRGIIYQKKMLLCVAEGKETLVCIYIFRTPINDG